MKIIIVIFCLISTKSVFSIDVSSLQEMHNFRRSQSPLNPYQRINLNVAKLLILKQLLESDCIKGISYQHPKFDGQKLSPKADFDRTSLSRNKLFSNTRNQITSDGVETKYFLNPKIIMVPSLANSMQSVTNNSKNHKGLNKNKNLSLNSQNSAGYRKEVQLTGTTKRESFPKFNNKGFLQESINTSKIAGNNTVSTSDAKIPRIPLHPTSLNLPKSVTTPNPFNSLKTNAVQTYEVEEIIEGTMAVDQEPGFEFLGNEIKNIPSEKKEKEVIDNSLKKIINNIMGLEKNTPSGHQLNPFSGDEGEKQSWVETTTKFHPPVIGAPQNETKLKPNSSNDFYSKGNSLFKTSSDNPGAKNPVTVNPINKNYKNFQTKPPNNNKFFNFGIADEKKGEQIDVKGSQTISHPFFKFFNKGPFENQRLKSKNLNFFTLSPILSDELHSMSEQNTKLELTTNLPLMSTVQTMREASTTTIQPTNRMFGFHLDPLNTEYNFGIHKENVTSSEFPDPALTVDLFSPSIKPEFKKDQELNGKNSRKMNFNQYTNKEITVNQVTESSEIEPRRSDILIADNMEDYIDDENYVSALSYLKKMNSNSTILSDDSLTDMKLASYIPLIPHILNDIRGNKISRQDFAVLSNVFGKYWSKILSLSSNAELDFLPLLQLKNENDLANFLENYFSNEIKTSTMDIEPQDYGKDYPEQFYDYMYEYKDFYDTMLNKEPGKKGKRHKRDKQQKSKE